MPYCSHTLKYGKSMARVWLHYGIYMLRACLIYGNLMGRKRHFLYITMAEIWLMTLMTTIPAPQSQSQWGSAKKPSAISISPQTKYITQNATLPTSEKRRPKAPRNRKAVMKFGRYFI